jgi:hypothetical protein
LAGSAHARESAYDCRLISSASLTELNIAHPRIVAESIQDWDGFAIEAQGTFALGVMLAIAALVLMIVSGNADSPRK